jgi:nucleoside-diphosphate-sugar epimerase
MKTILLTGANGFVGSHVLEAFMKRDDVKVVAACRDPQKLLPEYKGEVRVGDLRDQNYVDSVLDGIDIVCHAAAWTSAWSNKENSRRLYLEPTVNFINAVIRKKISRFVNLSTTSAAAPDRSDDPDSLGIARALWPHLCSVVEIEDYLRERADQGCTMINLRCGLFTGRRYGIGLLPLLLPRLKTHLVPWVVGGKTSMPLTDGRDIAQAFVLAALAKGLSGYESFNIVGKEIPTAREVLTFFNDEFGYPTPHFSVPFFIAYRFASLMEKLDPLVPWEPLVTRSIIHLLEEVNVSNKKAEQVLGYQPGIDWKQSVRLQIKEMHATQKVPMKMFKPVTS